MNTKLRALVAGEIGTPQVEDVINELVGIAQRTDHIKVANKSGGNFTKGTLVSFDGYDITLGAVTVVKADASPSRLCDAVLSEAILNNAAGIAYTAGVVGGLACDWAVGTKVYLSETAGEFSNVVPSDPGDAVQVVGVVTVRHASAGSILFFPGAAAPGSMAGAYMLPATGIPSTDMTAAVQLSLGKADSALQVALTVPAANVPDSAELTNPTTAEFNALLSALKVVGLMVADTP